MSYLALARKWRPRTFSQLIGQDHINKALIKSLEQKKLHHAYLFTGTRGVGKTSIARLMAKALNCEEGISANPCLRCSACIAIEEGRFIDLIEVDAASKTRVEDTREILENIVYAPTCGRFKIYLIDEVHMLSNHSFNALLKTLEEPPEHVKFLLATTDPQKLPITVLSRCLQFNLKHISIEAIAQQLKYILQQEQLVFEEAAIHLLAKAAKGSMRDALSLLDQAIAGSDNLTLTDIKSILGYSQKDYALQLLRGLINNDASALIQLCNEIAEEGGYFSYILEQILDYLHQLTLCAYLPPHAVLQFSAEVQALAAQFTPEDIQLFYQIALKGNAELYLMPSTAINFQMIILRMLTFRPAPAATIPPLNYSTPASSIKTASTTTSLSAEKVISTVPIEPSIQIPSIKNTDREPQKSYETPPASINWPVVLNQLSLKGLAHTASENAEFLAFDNTTLTLKAARGHQSLFTPSVIKKIEQELVLHLQQKIKLQIIFDESISASPAQKKQIQTNLNLQEAEACLIEDPVFQKLKDSFSAEFIKNSIEPHKNGL